MKIPKVVRIGLVLAVIGLVIGGAIFLKIWFQPKRDIPGEKPAHIVATAELTGDFIRDAAGAEEKYKNSVVELTGQITSAETDSRGNVNLLFSSDGADVQFTFLGEFNEAAAKLKAGDLVTVKGNYTGYVMDDILGLQIKFNNGYLKPAS